MANYRIANEKEAATIGGGTSYTSNLAVTKIRAISLGCTIRLESYTDNLLVALKDLQKIESLSCTCNSGVCDKHGYNAGCSGECTTVNTSCSCNSGKCSCNGYRSGCYNCYSDSECGCNSGVCSCNGYDAGCSMHCILDNSDCDCNSGVCSCNGYVAACNSKGICSDGCSHCVCEDDCGMDHGCFMDDWCTSLCMKNNVYGCACEGYCGGKTSGKAGCSNECYVQQPCNVKTWCDCHHKKSGCSTECYSDYSCSCNSGVCYCDVEYSGCSDCYSLNSCRGKSTCSCNNYNPGCSKECHTQDSCSCNTVCTNDCSVNYG